MFSERVATSAVPLKQLFELTRAWRASGMPAVSVFAASHTLSKLCVYDRLMLSAWSRTSVRVFTVTACER